MSFQLRTELCHNTGTQGIQRVSLSHDIIFLMHQKGGITEAK